MTKIIVTKQIDDCDHLLGQFLDDSHYDLLIEEDTDCYLPLNCGMGYKSDCKTDDCANCKNFDTKDETRIAFKFRKNFFSKEEQEQAYIGLKEAATQSQNRGLAAGPKGEKCLMRDWVTDYQISVLDYLTELQSLTMTDIKEDIKQIEENNRNTSSSRGLVWLADEVKEHNFTFDAWLDKTIKLPLDEITAQSKWVANTFISDTTYANPVNSGIAGWFDRYPRIPYGRATSYTANHFNKFKLSFPFLKSLDDGFQKLLPKRWKAQREAANRIDQAFLVPRTVFSTITVNKTFRTAAHRDAGDFSDGLSNLLVLSNDGKFTGGYLILPQIRMAINVRPGDLLLINNHECIHGNTPIVCEEGSERISLVCYLREKMLELGTKEYEDARFEFVESRRKNPEHPEQRKLWNGISKAMWDSQEWYDYLETNKGKEMVAKYHPEAYNKQSSLESLFG